ncbi:DNA-binding transcriptional regulator, XRE-family HTH domain [Propionispira arboris]|uniref:DNA-binding transcriptional regulator, XRE-family HTH domain n=1 Tax=Propionispira arboris TaxID=84035 RepID=A0A1H6TYQ9_9FIRM|nr:helix-turn-helix transcriptional regulator [Propionispira arboris]SEI85169.1 DNA-binding transcriptional regulator, XRE-family HTH domain [Propionispira arboris]
MSIGENLRKLRSDNKLTQKNLADILNVSRTTYVKYETDSIKLSFEKASKLADFFEVTTDYLLEKQTKTNPAISFLESEPSYSLDLAKIINQAEIIFNGNTYKLNDTYRKKILASIEVTLTDMKNNNQNL